MRNFTFIISLVISLLYGSNAYLQPAKSPMFGKDIIIRNIPNKDQRNVAICSAFNGWLFAVFSYAEPAEGKCSIYRSTDNGINWTLLADGGLTGSGGWEITKLDIIACGNSLATLKIFLGYAFYDTTTVSGYMCYGVNRFNGNPFFVEEVIFSDNSIRRHDLALCTDHPYSALNSNPNSISVVYSNTGLSDSLICLTSSNGGMSFDHREIVRVSDSHIGAVDLCYGKSLSAPNGRYFAVWEEKEDENTTFGHIYTAHSEPNFNSNFSTPVCLDSLVPNTVNRCRRPTIACQSSNYDNAVSDLTEVILYEKNDIGNNKNQIYGFYNLHASTSEVFNGFSLTNPLDNDIQPSAAFNHFDSTFYVTYFDSTQQKLPLLSNNMNLQNPDTWDIVSSGYNDGTNIDKPFPRVSLDFQNQTLLTVWTGKGQYPNGVAYFDALNSTYTGIHQNLAFGTVNIYSIFPNPCSELLTISFDAKAPEEISFELVNMYGRKVYEVTPQKYSIGDHDVKLDLSDFAAGCYILKCKSSHGELSVAKILHR